MDDSILWRSLKGQYKNFRKSRRKKVGDAAITVHQLKFGLFKVQFSRAIQF